MRSHIKHFTYAGRYIGVCAFGDIHDAVFRAGAVRKVRKFIHVVTWLEPKVPKQIKRRILSDHRNIKRSGSRDHITRFVLFIDCDQHTVRRWRYLNCRIDDTAVVRAIRIRRQHIKTISKLKHYFCVHHPAQTFLFPIFLYFFFYFYSLFFSLFLFLIFSIRFRLVYTARSLFMQIQSKSRRFA